jgi:hypothetical protein
MSEFNMFVTSHSSNDISVLGVKVVTKALFICKALSSQTWNLPLFFYVCVSSLCDVLMNFSFMQWIFKQFFLYITAFSIRKMFQIEVVDPSYVCMLYFVVIMYRAVFGRNLITFI